MEASLETPIIKNIKYLTLMAEISISPKIASKVSNNYWTELFRKPHENASWEPFKFHYTNIKKIMKPTKNDVILDAGSGGGELTYLFHEDGFNVKGFDSSEYSITKAKKRFGNDLFYLDDLVNMKTRGERFTKIFLNGVFLCIHPTLYKTVLKNLYNITKDNGIVYLFDNPDYSKRNRYYNQFRARTRVLSTVTFFLPVYKAHLSGFWVKTRNVKKSALDAGFSKAEKLESWSSSRSHHILFK